MLSPMWLSSARHVRDRGCFRLGEQHWVLKLPVAKAQFEQRAAGIALHPHFTAVQVHDRFHYR